MPVTDTNPASDITAPTLVSAETSSDGNKVILTFSEALNTVDGATLNDSNGNNLQFGLNVNSVGYSISHQVSGNTVELSSSIPINSGETVAFGYIHPSDSTNPGDKLRDLAGNDLISISNFAVTNSSALVSSSGLPTLSLIHI